MSSSSRGRAKAIIENMIRCSGTKSKARRSIGVPLPVLRCPALALMEFRYSGSTLI